MRVTKTMTIIATGVLTVSVSAPSKGYNGVAISMTASWNTGAVGPFLGQVAWGDGAVDAIARQSAKSVTKTHTYTTNGTYTITVNVSDEGTLTSGSGTASIQVAAQLAASFSASPTSGAIPLTVTFTSGISGGYTPYTWSINPGDGSTPYSGTYPGAPFNQAHTYTKVGTFTATLTATDALGASVVSRSKISIGMEGVTIQPWIILAELAVGVVMIKLSR